MDWAGSAPITFSNYIRFVANSARTALGYAHIKGG